MLLIEKPQKAREQQAQAKHSKERQGNQEYVRLLKLSKEEYQKLFQENKILKERINSIEKEKIIRKNKK